MSCCTEYDFPGDDTPIIQWFRSERSDLRAPTIRTLRSTLQSIELMDAVDEYIPTPERNADLPFLMPVEDIFTITGRGTVATGRVERGQSEDWPKKLRSLV